MSCVYFEKTETVLFVDRAEINWFSGLISIKTMLVDHYAHYIKFLRTSWTVLDFNLFLHWSPGIK